MELFHHYKLEKNKDGYTIFLYLNQNLTEFSSELNFVSEDKKENLNKNAQVYIIQKFPRLKITAAKIMLGSMVIGTIPLFNTQAFASNQTQISSSTQNFTIIINNIKVNTTKSPLLVNGRMFVALEDVPSLLKATTWFNGSSNTVGINKEDKKIAFIIGSTMARVNGNSLEMPISFVHNNIKMIPLRFIAENLGYDVHFNSTTQTISLNTPTKNLSTYTVTSGDSLFTISKKFNTTVDTLRSINNLTTDVIFVGQKINISSDTTSSDLEYITHTIQSGENAWLISISYGIPMTEFLALNNLQPYSILNIDQKVKIPIRNIPVKPTPGPGFGEYLDWWTEAQYVFPIGRTAKVTDFATKKTFFIKRTIGANHADCEPLTSQDAAIIKEIWGGSYSWKERAVLVELDGRKIAASMTSMPHDVQYINNNNFNGHFDIHFLNSTRHVDGKLSDAHQTQIRISAGVK